MFTRWRMAIVLAVGVVVGSLAGQPASAAQGSAAGSVILFETTMFGGDTARISYLGCATRVAVPAHLDQVGSYDNRPPIGCQVALVGPAGSHVLCTGRAVVPLPFRDATEVRVSAGRSVLCRLVTA